MPSTVVVVRILVVSYNIMGSTMAISAKIKVCLAASVGRWRQVVDMETPPTSQTPLYVSLNDRWCTLKQWISLLMEPHTHMRVQAGPTGRSKFGGSEAGFVEMPRSSCV